MRWNRKPVALAIIIIIIIIIICGKQHFTPGVGYCLELGLWSIINVDFERL